MGGHIAFLASVFKFGMGLGLFIGIGFLSLFGYVDLSQTLDVGVERGIRLGASWLPALMLLLPVLMMWRYPIDGARHAEIRAALAERRRSIA
jgi:Na+/melibiose symporter-like transporter